MRFSNPYKLRKVRLGDICTITGGYAFDSHKMKQQGEYQIIKMGNLYNGIFDLSRNQSFINAPTKKELEYLIQKNDILITLTGTTNKKDYGYTVQIEKPKKLLLNQRCALIRASKVNEKYLFYLLNSNDFLKQFYASSTGGTGNQTNVSINDMLDFKVYISNENDQLKISNILNALDKKISTQIKIIRVLESQKKELSNILFNKYCKDSSYYPLEDIVSSESIKDFQIQTKDYLPNGKFEVVDQGKKEIIGYSDNSNKLYTKVPVIVYGDHTTIIKYREIPFIVGGDGVKLLKAKTGFLQKYIYYAVCQFNISSEGYKRHWNMLKNVLIPIPNYETQKIIIDTLDSFTNKIKNEEALLEKYRLQKQFLLNNLFI